jgi:hypothetical protein
VTQAGQLALPGGTVVASGGVQLGSTGSLIGYGAVVGRISSSFPSMTGAITVSADKTLTIGDANQVDGVALDGATAVGALGGRPSKLILLDANRATIGDTTLFAGSLLDAPNGITLPSARKLSANGPALVDGDFTNNGIVKGPPPGPSDFLSFNDNVNGAGSYVGNIEFLQGFSPGGSAAAVSLENVAFSAHSTLAIELGGTTAGSQFDQLVIAGNVTLNSARLDVATLGGFVPSAGQSFEILDIAGTRTGTFGGLEEGARAASFGGTDLFITYLGGDGNDVALIAVLGGDFNRDRRVDAADYVVWRKGLGPTYSFDDYDVWRANFGRTTTKGSGSSDSATVPEPTSLPMLLIMAIALKPLRRQFTK